MSNQKIKKHKLGDLMKNFTLIIATLLICISTVKSEKLFPVGESYIDPELGRQNNVIVYQKGNGEVWLKYIDPVTGRIDETNNSNELIDVGATAVVETFNGPEIGYSKDDWRVIYTKPVNGINQVWQRYIDGNEVKVSPITTGTKVRQTGLASKNTNANSIRIAYAIGGFEGVMAWKDLSNPEKEVIIDSVDRGIRWIDQTNKLVYIKQTGLEKGEIFVYDTDTESEEQITNSGSINTNPYGWIAPDYGNELIIAALAENDSKIYIYRKVNNRWNKIQEIGVPEEAKYDFFGSPEPFVVEGKSYISCVIKEEPRAYAKSEVWVLSLSQGRNTTFELLQNDNQGDLIRTDPESFIGKHEAFIYYNIIEESGEFAVYRTRTNIIALNDDGIENIRVYPKETNSNLSIEDEPHHVMYYPQHLKHLNKLLLYFPGTRARPYDYLKFCNTAAKMGYHAISLSYENDLSVNYDACFQSQDLTCHGRARNEIWFGEDSHEKINVDQDNSIINRLEKLLIFLKNNYPSMKWDLYIDDNDNIIWNNIVVAGHSQGGGHAGYASKQFAVDRCIMFAASDWVQGQTSEWIRTPGPTTKEKYFGFIHVEDLPAYSVIMPTWNDYGLLDFGMPVNTDLTDAPYNNSHALITSAEYPDSILAHNYPIVDVMTPSNDDFVTYYYSPVWQYLLLNDEATSVNWYEEEQLEIEVYPNPASEQINIRFTDEIPHHTKHIIIHNSLSQQVKSIQISNDSKDYLVNVSDLTAGIYFISFGNYKTKFVKI